MGSMAITHVNGKDVTTGSNKIRQPASMEVEIQDISASDAGRTADTKMHKKTLRTVCALSLSWSNLSTADASAILNLFSEREYFTVRYLDPYTGGYNPASVSGNYKTFYVGNRTIPLYNAELDIWSNVSFKIVER